MHGKTLTLPVQKTADSTRTETGRFRWLKNKLPLVASLAVVGAALAIVVNSNTESNRLAQKMRTWDQALVQSRECGDGYHRVLDEIRAEQSRLLPAAIKTGDTTYVDRLVNIERMIELAHQYNLEHGICPRNASR